MFRPGRAVARHVHAQMHEEMRMKYNQVSWTDTPPPSLQAARRRAAFGCAFRRFSFEGSQDTRTSRTGTPQSILVSMLSRSGRSASASRFPLSSGRRSSSQESRRSEQ
eukprot:254716-Prymnesium_polylepis.1